MWIIFCIRNRGLIAATNPEPEQFKQESSVLLGRIGLSLHHLIFQIAQLPSDNGVVLSTDSAAFFTLALTFRHTVQILTVFSSFFSLLFK
jgi:hypothetical protein